MKLITAFTFPFILLMHTAHAQVLATIGEERKITKEEFTAKFKMVREQAVINQPTADQFLEDLIRYEIGLIEAKKLKVANDPVVSDRINQEIYKGLLEKELGAKTKKIKIVDKDMRDWYSNNPELRTSHILIQHKVDATSEEIKKAKDRAETILSEVVKSKRPFSELVKLYSDDTLSKQNGGDVDWQSRLTLVPDYYNAALKLKPNEISKLVKTPFGFHIIKLTGRRNYENANKQQIRTAVFEVKRKEIFDSYFSNLKKRYPVKINQQLVQ